MELFMITFALGDLEPGKGMMVCCVVVDGVEGGGRVRWLRGEDRRHMTSYHAAQLAGNEL
jgi:hypothetical protein